VAEDDVAIVIEALFDIRTELRRIRLILEDDDGADGDAGEDS
jgi:hypothetical protein